MGGQQPVAGRGLAEGVQSGGVALVDDGVLARGEQCQREAGVRLGRVRQPPGVRTLAVPGSLHVKTALSARLTSSVRDISVASVAASADLSAFGERLAARLDGLLP
ncbi:hypothetical protein SVIOM342S_05800 [Streptomyces violaceorubidus]